MVKRAHEILAKQPGNDLTRVNDFAHIASQSSKIARKLGNIRNQFGGGHGRAHMPDIRDEMVDLALDGGLIWTRWALRRLGLFSEGRPKDLIRDLVEEPATFRSGDLRRRLEAANLPDLEPHHQRELGIAVGQRVMRQTFVVRWDGLDPCLESDDLTVWPADYRIGLLHGLWFAPDDQPTMTPWLLRKGIEVIDPIPDASEELEEQVKLACRSTQFFPPDTDLKDREGTVKWLENHITDRPASERPALTLMLQYLTDAPPPVVPHN
ncbi:hypothetical protein D4740_10410 [Actinomyces sp. 2119]|uniref:abortive infection family protein n=1 Tax=Actinomyces sp. 2119 TaxID=2321393 RepID=UPI000E6C3833|nr:abortive infection family protein [Actinomyces sp. 2119]RJF40936.1 hypothetical protein D4740_10410 [Actinomyces sp. 2119]